MSRDMPAPAREEVTDVTVVVLAGGRGTRLGALHPDTAKPMIMVRGRPFLYWLTSWLARHGLSHFVYSTGYRGEQIAAWCRNGDFPHVDRVCHQETEPLGTGGGLFNCLDACRAWTLVANGDGLCMAGLDDLLRLRRRPGAAGGLLGVPVADAARYGSLDVDDGGRLRAFREKVPGAGYVNGGFYLFRTDVLRGLRRAGASSIERDLVPDMLAAGTPLDVVRPSDCAFIDIGTPETLAQAESFIDRHFAVGHPMSAADRQRG